MIKQKKFYQIDVLYCIGVILVIFGHSHYSNWSTFQNTFYDAIVRFIYEFHMPLFFFVAGFLFINSNKLERIGYKKWAIEKTIKMTTPYIVLSLLVILPKFYLENRTFDRFAFYMFKSIFAPRFGPWGHFWFLPILLVIYLLFGVWKKYLFKTNNMWVLVATCILSLALYFVPYDTPWLGFSDLKTSIIFFALGIAFYFVQAKISINKNIYRAVIAIALIAVSVLLFKFYSFNKIIMLLVAIVMLVALWNIACLVGENKFSKWISKNNFTIYIYSWPFQAVAMTICMILHMPWYVASLVMFLIGLGMPIAVIYIYSKLNKIHNKFFDLVLGVK